MNLVLKNMKMEVGSVSAAKMTKEGKWEFSKLLWSFPSCYKHTDKGPRKAQDQSRGLQTVLERASEELV